MRCTPTEHAQWAWVHARGADVVPIPGTKRVEYLEQNVAALDLGLTDDELTRLDGLAEQVAGGRSETLASVGSWTGPGRRGS